MLIYVLNPNLERVGAIDTFTSIIWTNRYYSYGDFELYLSVTDRNMELLKAGNLLVREGYEDNAMIIETIVIATDVENGNYMTVSGRCLKSLLYRRIVWNQTSLTGNLETCIARLLNENIINPEISERVIDGFINGNTLETSATVDAQYTGDNLGEAISALCQSTEIGWDVLLDDTRYKFILYKGTDRSYAQTDIPYVIFSNEYENLLTTTYTYDARNYSNLIKVAGEGQGIARKFVTVGNATGINRYESFSDESSVSSNDGETMLTDYEKLLTEKGQEKLAELDYIETFEGEVEANYTFKFNEDYFMGDIVEVVNEYGIAASTRILEVIQAEDETGIYTIPTFSNYILKED